MDRLAELRERRALTLRELAEISGVAADTINQIELGHRKARPSTLRKLAKALDIGVEDFYAEPALPGKAEASREAGLVQVDELPGLRKARESRGLTRDELSFRTGLPASDITRLEEGQRAPAPGDVELLARILGCFKGDLFLPTEVMEAFGTRDAQENERLRREAENLTAKDIRALILASPAFRKLSKALEESTDQESREVG